MRNSLRLGPDADNIPDREDEETVDRAFDSPEGRLLTLIKAREVLGKMTRAQLEDLATDLDASMVATLRHILSNRMYDPLEESDEMELEEAATDYHKYINQGIPEKTALAMSRGTAEQEAKYRKMRDQGYGDSEARSFVYRTYSAFGQR
jgi:hypothetical protein